MKETAKILIVDDDQGLVHFLSRFFAKQEYEVRSCHTGRSALDLVTQEQFGLILLDYKMPCMNGLDTLKEIRALQVKTPIIVMTAFGTMDTAIEAMKLGAYDYLVKPFDRDELQRLARDALEVNRLMTETVSLPETGAKPSDASSPPKGSARIVGTHRKMQEVYKLIGQVAHKDVTILITGESGTGKELVARAIYHHSLRKHKPFLAVNCAAIPETLFESDLFGHERGAFTGADRTHIGKFERCHGGTLFFDEIGDMSLSTQAKLLRLLQFGEFERVGGAQTLEADVRIIAATHKDLEQAVEGGAFREDLYWRLKVISIHLPPLRERREDIPALVEYFIGRFNEEYRTSIKHVDDAAMARLESSSWPGNVRELENCMRRAVLLSLGDIIREDHLKLHPGRKGVLKGDEREQAQANIERLLHELVPDLLQLYSENAHESVLDVVERALINNVLEQCGLNQVKTARLLGISRNTLRHRMKKYNLQVSGE